MKQMSLKEVLRRFAPYFRDYISYFIIAIAGMLMASGGTAASAWVIEPVLNKIFIEKNKDLLYLLPYAIIAIYFLKSLPNNGRATTTKTVKHEV